MGRLNFIKMVGTGNDFVVVDNRPQTKDYRPKTKDRKWNKIVRALCDRKTGVGADGVLVLEESKKADFKMLVFNADGSVAEMCGNGLRCAVLYIGTHGYAGTSRHQDLGKIMKVETKAGIYEGGVVAKDRVKVKMQEPIDLKLDFPINVNGCEIRPDFINTGVPHVAVFVEGLKRIDVEKIGSAVRYHDEFKPKGTNVNFVEIIDNNNIEIRTYERGVENETLACGTGAVASAILTGYRLGVTGRQTVNVRVRGGILKVEFQKINNKIKNVYLEGEARIVFTGQITL